MSLFDSASLVVTPSGYKEDKLYSIKPTDGSGDLVVTRATTATRVNSDGLVEIMPYNLLFYSDDYSNAYWTKQNTTITANAITSPTGTLTADKLVITSSGVTGIFGEVITSSGNYYTTSVYAKKAETQYVNLGFIYNAGTYAATQFDLNNGTVKRNNSSSYTGLSSTITSVGNGWYRLTVTCIINTPTAYPCILPSNAEWTSGEPRQNLTGNNTTGAYFWGLQLVSGTSAKEYFPTTDRLDIPRLDYTNSTCPSILVEPQRTNKYPYSEQFNNAFWLKNNITVTSDQAIAPDGTNTADRIQDTIATNFDHIFNYTMSFTAGVQYTASFYVKNVDINYFGMMFIPNAFGTRKDVIFNVQNGTITRQDSGITASIINMGNGWYRCIATATATVTTTTPYGLFFGPTASATSMAYTSTTIKSLYLWGAQLEEGSYATSYIPTVASSVTRNADVISKTGISSLIGQTEGTLFVDFIINAKSGNTNILNSERNTTASFSVGVLNDGRVDADLFSSGSPVARITQGSLVVGQRYKVAYSYKSGGTYLYINGALAGTSTDSFTLPSTIDDIFLNDVNSYFNNMQNVSFKTAALWKTRLSNTELATLTTI